MKPIIFASLLLIGGSAAAQRQTIGIQAGPGWTKVRSNNSAGPKSAFGNLNLGLNYERFIGRRLTFGASLLFQQRGFRQDITIFDLNAIPMGTARVRFKYNYLALPLTIGYHSGGASFGFVRLGLVPSVLMSASARLPAPPNFEEVKNVDRTAAVERFELGGILEAGRGFPLGQNLQGTVSLALQHSITPVLDADHYFQSDLRYYGAYLNLGVQYKLPRRKAQAAAAE